ncbi:hypothetical protein [Microbacterium esteraromaticum]|nr:hypothetical protein [Microbacterium esteraromaticum]
MSDPQQLPPYAHPAQPGYPAPGYTGAPAPQGHPGPYPSAAQSTGSLGRIALILGILTVALSLVSTVATPFMLRGMGDMTLLSVFNLVVGLITFVLVVVTLVLGILGIRRRQQAVSAGIAIGIAASGLVGLLSGMLSGALFTMLN